MEAYVKSDLPVLEPNIHYLQVTVICKWLRPERTILIKRS